MSNIDACSSARKRIVVCLSGAGTTLQAIIDKLQKQSAIEIEIALVISNKPDVGGLAIARAHAIPTITLTQSDYPDRISYCDALHEIIAPTQPDLIVLAGFMLVLSETFVGRWYGKLINIHPSLLPKYRGLHTHEKALTNKDTTHGTTVHFVSSELDAGPIIAQAECTIVDAKSVDEVKARVQALEHDLYPRIITQYLCGEIAAPKAIKA